MIEFRGGWLAILVIVGLLVLWELLYYQGLIDPLRFSHPFAIPQILGDSAFLQGLAVLLAQVGLTSLVGGLVGLGFGALIIRSPWLTRAIIPVLRIGLWFPFLVLWVHPIFSTPQEGSWSAGIAWVATVIAFILIPAVALSSCYDYIATRSLLGQDGHPARSYVIRGSILQGLFISLLAQMSLSAYKWDWFDVTGSRGVAVGYAAMIVVVVLIGLVDRAFRTSFDSTARMRADIAMKQAASKNCGSLWKTSLIGVGCLVFGLYFYFYPLVSSPADIVKAIYRLVSTGTTFSQRHETIWYHFGISTLELIIGLILAGGLAIVVRRVLSNSVSFRNWALPLLPLTYIAPFVLSVILVVWAQPYGVHPWRVSIGVALLTFFPFLQTLSGLRGHPVFCQILLATDEALPFAVVAVLFGEAFGSVGGLGLVIVAARATLQIAEGIAAILLALVLLIVLSSSLRWVLKWRYSSTGS